MVVEKIDDWNNFNWKFYVNYYNDLKEAGINNEQKAKRHYFNIGHKEGRLITCKEMLHFDVDFYMNYYCYLNKEGVNTPYKAKKYYLKKGMLENHFKNYVDMFMHTTDWEKFTTYNAEKINLFNLENKNNMIDWWKQNGLLEYNKYPTLFSKYLLNFKNPFAKYNYNIYNFTNDFVITSKFICSIHCYDLSQFKKMFLKLINKIKPDFKFIITFVIDSQNVRSRHTNKVFLKVPNKGFDIINKFIVTYFLKKNNIDYNYILFTHSKTDDKRRNAYLSFIIENYNEIITQLNSQNNNLGGIFPNMIHVGERRYYMRCKETRGIEWHGNYNYVNELKSFLNIETTNYFFIEGNTYILKKDVSHRLFGNIQLFNLLNDDKIVDLNWLQIAYKLPIDLKLDQLYEHYKKNNCYNNFFDMYQDPKIVKKYRVVRDGMYEHAWERLVLCCVIDMKYDFQIYNLKKHTLYNNTYLNNVLKQHIINNNVNYEGILFDCDFYKSSYVDLKHQRNGFNFWNHFCDIGFYEGRVFNKLQHNPYMIEETK
jgi:hypothetical protein